MTKPAKLVGSVKTQRLVSARIVWAEIRRLKTFRLADLDVPNLRFAANFVQNALCAGLLTVLEPRRRGKTGALYQLVRDVGRRCPRFSRGNIDPMPTPAERMWAAFKPLRGGFTVRELASLTRVGESGALQYVNALRRYGYLEVLVAPVGRSKPVEGRFRLVASMNTGPDAPQVLRNKSVWDPNTGALAVLVSE